MANDSWVNSIRENVTGVGFESRAAVKNQSCMDQLNWVLDVEFDYIDIVKFRNYHQIDHMRKIIKIRQKILYEYMNISKLYK